MFWNRAIGKIEGRRAARRKVSAWWGVVVGAAVAIATVAGVVVFSADDRAGELPEAETAAEAVVMTKKSVLISEVKPDIVSAVYRKLQRREGARLGEGT